MITDKAKEELVKAARYALATPYAHKLQEKYSAAVLTSEGNIYPGISYFSDTYSLTLHGEQAALSHAASHGENEIVAIAVASLEEKKKGEFTNPCNMCKQLFYETQKRTGVKLLVILTNNHDETCEIMFDEMNSFPWPQ